MDKKTSREAFEAWYTTHAPNYTRDPIGSRDCSLQWEAWQAAIVAERERVERITREWWDEIRKGETP